MGKKRRLSTLTKASAVSAADGEYDNNNRQSKHGGKSSGKLKQVDRDGDDNDDNHEGLSCMRQTDHLYVALETLDCALIHGCVPCAYKIGCFDVALDKEFCKVTPNQRPEQCPRSPRKNDLHATHNNNNYDGVLGFRPGMSILTVGDGDFSFSLGLARRLLPGRSDSKQTANQTFLVATSYESESTLRKVYPDFDATLSELHHLGVHVAYNVDATKILETLTLPHMKSSSLENRFHRICWNFPCTAIGGGQDGQNKAMEDNKELVRHFVESARSVLVPRGDGELYVCHKTKPPFNQWNLQEVALEGQRPPLEVKEDPPLLHYSGRIVLDRFLLPPYTPRKALDKKSFPCHDACFYIFAQEEPPSAAGSTTNRPLFAPTIPRKDKDDGDGETTDGSNTHSRSSHSSSSSSSKSPATTLVKIDSELIQLLRRKHMNNRTSINSAKKRKRNTSKYKKKGGGFFRNAN